MAGYAHNPLVLIYSLKRGYTLNIAMYSESLVFNGKVAEIYNNITLMSFMNYIILEMQAHPYNHMTPFLPVTT